MKITSDTVKKVINRFKGKTERIDRLLADGGQISRMAYTASMIPNAKEPDNLLVDVGGSIFWLPIYQEILGYKKVVILCRPGAGKTCEFDKDELGISQDFNVDILECDAELSKYPVNNGLASAVVCFEILEHFAGDPMHLVQESNRILKGNGFFCLTTPNFISRMNVARIALGMHHGWSVFTDSFADRHNREYTPFEIRKLLECGGFEVNLLQTFTFGEKQSLLLMAFGSLLSLPAFLVRKVPLGMRGTHIAVCAKKIGPILDRYPDFLYELYGEDKVRFKIPLTLIHEKYKEES